MKIVQDKLRNRQALLVSGLITLIFTSLFLFIIYEQRTATASEGINRLQTRLMDIFNDNELIADAIGERYHHTINGGRCGNKSRFVPREEGSGESTPIESGYIRHLEPLSLSSPASRPCVCLPPQSLSAEW